MSVAGDSDKLVAQFSRVLQASPEKIFEAWVNADWLVRWFAPFEKSIAHIDIDARVGGRYRIEMADDGDGGRVLEGEYLEVERPRRLVFTWTNYLRASGVPRAVDSVVTVDITMRDPSHTELRILHKGFFDDRVAKIHQGSWTSVVDKLDAALRN